MYTIYLKHAVSVPDTTDFKKFNLYVAMVVPGLYSILICNRPSSFLVFSIIFVVVAE